MACSLLKSAKSLKTEFTKTTSYELPPCKKNSSKYMVKLFSTKSMIKYFYFATWFRGQNNVSNLMQRKKTLSATYLSVPMASDFTFYCPICFPAEVVFQVISVSNRLKTPFHIFCQFCTSVIKHYLQQDNEDQRQR